MEKAYNPQQVEQYWD